MVAAAEVAVAVVEAEEVEVEALCSPDQGQGHPHHHPLHHLEDQAVGDYQDLVLPDLQVPVMFFLFFPLYIPQFQVAIQSNLGEVQAQAPVIQNSLLGHHQQVVPQVLGDLHSQNLKQTTMDLALVASHNLNLQSTTLEVYLTPNPALVLEDLVNQNHQPTILEEDFPNLKTQQVT